MVEIQLEYQGELHCSATHMPSGSVLSTDAPVDNNGRGEAFSPTDLVATALAACFSTVMGIVAERKGIDLRGMKIRACKHMSAELPRRIAKIELEIEMPLPGNHPDRVLLEQSGRGCPVKHSIHPEIEVPIQWRWLPNS